MQGDLECGPHYSAAGNQWVIRRWDGSHTMYWMGAEMWYSFAWASKGFPTAEAAQSAFVEWCMIEDCIAW